MYHIAQVNITRLQEPVGNANVHDFFDNLGRINELAERSDGFVWCFEDNWISSLNTAHLPLWWIKAVKLPLADEAMVKLNQYGSSQSAFSFT